jgi:hypothetical protein
MMQTKGDEKIMVSKATNNGSSAANTGKRNGSGRQTNTKGSRVTEARAKAQRAKLDVQAKIRQQAEEQEADVRQMQNKKRVRQDMQTKRRVIATLIEAYLQDHIGGNSSEKTLEWHSTALGLMRLFLEEELDITQIDEVEADDISAWFAHMRSAPAATGVYASRQITLLLHLNLTRNPSFSQNVTHTNCPARIVLTALTTALTAKYPGGRNCLHNTPGYFLVITHKWKRKSKKLLYACFFATSNTGRAASCDTTEKRIRAGRDLL